MIQSDAETLLSRLTPSLDAFGVCAVGKNHALRVGPADEIVVHYVLSGEGSLEWGDQQRQLSPGMVVIIPKKFPKMIAGQGTALTIIDATGTCVLADGIIKYETPELAGDHLLLACAKVSECAGFGLRLFDCLQEPLIQPQNPKLTWAFESIVSELSSPMIGCKAIIESLMKQIIVLTLRNVISREGPHCALLMTVVDPQLSRVINAIITRPAERHTAPEMARLSGMSSALLTRRFEQAFGQSPSQYLNHVRLGASIPLLLETKLPVKTIAAAVGFSSRSHFSRAFSKLHGSDPSSYRRGNRQSVH